LGEKGAVETHGSTFGAGASPGFHMPVDNRFGGRVVHRRRSPRLVR